jgi:tyrosine-protein phosphatase YwqE
MFDFFKKKKVVREKIELSRIKTDVHSHLIPGIDDGSKSTEDSLLMIKKMVEMGYSKIITTPHIMIDFYPNEESDIVSRYEKLKLDLKENQIEVDFAVAAEYYFDEFLLQKIQKKQLLTFAGNHVLFENSFVHEPRNIESLIFDFKTNFYQPVLAHFERYNYYDHNKAQELRERGTLIQLNLNSLSGHYGERVKKMAEKLIDEKLVDLVGTDCHKIEHLQLLEQNLSKEYFHKLLDLDLMNYKL